MNALAAIRNEVTRRLESIFPGYFPDAKHDHYRDFGYPTTLDFKTLYGTYRRNGLAYAGVEKTISKSWQDNPWLLEKERDGSQGGKTKETQLEKDIRTRFEALRLWQQAAEADRRGMVGKYSGLILRLADGLAFDKPVTRVPGGLDGLVEVIPAWEGQLTVAEWDTIPTSPTYGWPTFYQFSEAAVDGQKANNRQFRVHPDRVIIWSRDGTINGASALEPGYNDLLTMEKIVGAGGEGFWKNAKSAPVLQVDAAADVRRMAESMGIKPEEMVEKMNDQVEDWQRGFDRLLMLQGMEAKTLGVTLPSPEHFFMIALQGFAASLDMPLKILVGNQNGERASTEDAREWAQTNMGRRNNIIRPLLMELVRRLVRFKILPEKDWFLDWSDLGEASLEEKIARADKMADVNQKMKDTGEYVFTPEEMREAVDLEPLKDSEKYRDDTDDDDAQGAIGGGSEPEEEPDQ